MAAYSPASKFRSLFHNDYFMRLWLAQLISQVIMNAANYGILVLITEVTGSATLVGLAIIAFSLPAVIFGAPAGVFVDRMDKRKVLWVSNFLRGLCSFAFVLSLILNPHVLLPIYALTFFISLIGQFFTPAEGSSIPLLVSDEELVSALSLFNLTFTLSQAIGFILLGPLVLTLIPQSSFHIGHVAVVVHPVEYLFIIIGILYFICSFLVASIPHKKLTKTVKPSNLEQEIEELESVWSDIKESWKFLQSNRKVLYGVILLSLGGIIILTIGELATSFVIHLLNRPARQSVIIFVPAGIGLILGSVIMPRLINWIGRLRAIGTGVIGLSICIVLLVWSKGIAAHLDPVHWAGNPFFIGSIIILTFLAGLEIDMINIPAQAIIQEETPDWIKGRVLAFQIVLYSAISIPVLLFIGAVADTLSITTVMYVFAGLVLASGLGSVYFSMRKPSSPPPAAGEESLPPAGTAQNVPGRR